MDLASEIKKISPRKTALRISSIYIIIGVSWILLSEKILHWVVSEKDILTMISMLKGWAYVLVTGVLLFSLVSCSLYQTEKKNLAEQPDRKMALMFINIDNFKYINDTIGYLSGDELIISIGKRLMELMDDRKSVYRFGGDEFVVLIHQYELFKDKSNLLR